MASVLGLSPTALGAEDALPRTIEFNRDIRPILSGACFQCHGPDQAKRKADLRLDTDEGAFADRGGHRAIAPGDPAKSEMIRRLTAESDRQRMPPVKSGRKVSPQEIELIRRWILEGAKWQKHWAFAAPQRPPLPDVKGKDWPRNPIDLFILAWLEKEGLSPSPEADKTTLIRRATLDLTGLPPTLSEVDAFLADASPNAYEKVVDRLFASPRYGERMAARWLDAARYADTNGYQTDGERTMWRWRDWVIDAFNKNLPFDRFTIEQLAGDLLPGATLEQRIATGFHRNHRGNAEGGIIPEEYAVEYVVDRVTTTSTVWLGLTLGCARCHDHKFDPITQKEFYQVFAFFNSVPERGKAIKYGNSPPTILAPTPAQETELKILDEKLAAAENRFAGLEADLAVAQAAWEESLREARPVHWLIEGGLVARFEPEGAFDGRRFIEAGDVAGFGFYDKFSLAARVYPEGEHGGAVVSRMTETSNLEGYCLCLAGGKVQVNLVKRWLDDAIRVETESCLPPGRWHHIVATYDGSRLASGVKVYFDGRPEKLKVLLDDLNQSFNTSEPLRIGSGGGPETRFRGRLSDVRVYNRALSPDEAEVVATADSVTDIARIPAAERNSGQSRKLRMCFLEEHAPEPVQEARQELADRRREKERLLESIPTTMVMEELEKPRDAFVLIRGQYDQPGEKVARGVPACLPPLPSGAEMSRLGFARWLVDPSHPLTARVAVNRCWQMYFGCGLVETVDDFGSQGELPSHLELLDWLATEFMRSGWDFKALQKTVVTSATYRQSSKATAELLQKDPQNRLLGRMSRLRLPADTIRDLALAVSGLLVEKLGGPSVRPHQPAGLWKDLTEVDYKQDEGEGLYRRSLYTFWKRTVAPPTMMVFDASPRETCCVRETRTNTPLQALALMNDVVFVEAARALAQRMFTEGGETAESRIIWAFRQATARRPSPLELQFLLGGFEHHLGRFRQNTTTALEFLSAGEARRHERLNASELAANAVVASLILNLDEVITRE